MSEPTYQKLIENLITSTLPLPEADQTYIQRHFVATCILTLNKHLGGEISEKMREIRAIENITTITNSGTISETPDYQKAVFKIKFILLAGESYDHFLKRVFKRGLFAIKGVKLNKIQNVEEITPEDPK